MKKITKQIQLFTLLSAGMMFITVLTAGQSFHGDYQGVFSDQGRYPLNKKHASCAAQVIDAGNNNYVIHLTEKLYTGAGILGRAQGRMKEGSIVFESDGLSGTIEGNKLTGQLSFRDQLLGFELTKTERISPTLGAAPPEDAIILFDGQGFDPWIGDGERPVQWKILNGDEAEVIPVTLGVRPKHDIYTRKKFTDVYLHIEFKLPLMAEATGQQRANSGVIFEEVGEIQILDSYGLEGDFNECGAIYRNSPPKVNMAFPPMSWQTFDIIFSSPSYDKNGNRVGDGKMTVYHNGVRIHHEYPLKRGPAQLAPGEQRFPGSIRLQDHQNTLWFKNIWAVELDGDQPLPGIISQIE
ncbi:MAG: DUF1080 domain-containing protein [Bacteroidales bacterium]|nr:DUF1080 domain-containing protein [Bacteroidales bacterium]